MNEVLKEKLNIHNLQNNITTITNEEWQQEFQLMKKCIKPVSNCKLTRHVLNNCILGRRWNLTDNEYSDTQDKRYVDYINSVLKEIKSGETDYCYYYYQIIDLLKFEANLNSRLIHDGVNTYFEVWIDRYTYE